MKRCLRMCLAVRYGKLLFGPAIMLVGRGRRLLAYDQPGAKYQLTPPYERIKLPGLRTDQD
jgi:hypothetical protein